MQPYWGFERLLANRILPPWCAWDAALVLQISSMLIWVGNESNLVTWMFFPITFLAMGFLPGAIMLEHINSVHRWNVYEYLVIGMGLSLIYLSVLGALVNTIWLGAGIRNPLAPINVFIAHSALILFGIGLGYFHRENRHFEPPYPRKQGLKLLSLPVGAMSGAYLLRNYGLNEPLILVYILVGLLPIISVYRQDTELYPVALLSASLSLTLGTSLMIPHLNPAADATNEYMVSQTINFLDFWEPTLEIQRSGNFRLVFGQPVISALSGVNMVGAFKFIHPLFVGLIPVSLYFFYKRLWTADKALIASCFFMFIYTYFVIFPQNTRTSSAVLFMTLGFLSLAINWRTKPSKALKILPAIFFAGSIFSHYGTGYLVLLGFAFAWAFTVFVRNYNRLVSHLTPTSPSLASWAVVSLCVVFGLSFYTFVWDGKIMALVRAVFGTFNIVKSGDLIDAGSRATFATTEPFQSVSLVALRLFYLVFSVIIGLGGIAMAVDRMRGRTVPPDILLGFQIWMGMILILSFTPIAATYGIFRIYPISMVVLAICLPHGISKTRVLLKKNFNISVNNRYGMTAILLTFFLLLNAGVSGALLSHDRTPNIELDREYLMDHGNSAELYSLYSRLQITEDVDASAWLLKHREQDRTIYSDLLPGKIVPQYHVQHYIDKDDENVGPPNFKTIPNDTTIESRSYLFVGNYNSKTRSMITPGRTYIKQYSTVNRIPLPSVKRRFGNKIYTTGGSQVWVNGPGGV